MFTKAYRDIVKNYPTADGKGKLLRTTILGWVFMEGAREFFVHKEGNRWSVTDSATGYGCQASGVTRGEAVKLFERRCLPKVLEFMETDTYRNLVADFLNMPNVKPYGSINL